MSQPTKDSPPFWESKRNRIIMWIILYTTCLITLVLELFVHVEHPFHFIGFPLSSAVLGFVACTLMIIVAKGLALFLKKKVDYYEKDELL